MSRLILIISFFSLLFTATQSHAEVSKGELFVFLEKIMPALACKSPVVKCASHVSESQCLNFMAPTIKSCSTLYKSNLPNTMSTDVESAVIHEIGQCSSKHFMKKFVKRKQDILSCMKRAQK